MGGLEDMGRWGQTGRVVLPTRYSPQQGYTESLAGTLRGGHPATAVTDKGQGLPHHLASRDAREPQGPRAHPGLDSGQCVWKGRGGRETTGKKETGRQGCDTVNWREGREPELLGWFPGYSAYLIILLWDHSVSLKRMTELERTLLTIYLI